MNLEHTLVARKCPSGLVRVKGSYRGKKGTPYQLPSPDITSVGKTKVQSTESLCPVNRTPTRGCHCHTHPRPLEMSIRLQAGLAPQVQESLWTDYPILPPLPGTGTSWLKDRQAGASVLANKNKSSLPNLAA